VRRNNHMRRVATLPAIVAALVLAAAGQAMAQSTFKVPFKWESGGKKLAAGEYVVARTADGQVAVKQAATGKETVLPVADTLKPGGEVEPGATGARLVFDEVGNFEPSYTEYFTVYVLAEVWLSAGEGYLIHTTKGAHKHRTVGAEPRGR
jgi:hypothetical protein